ncbi:MAG: hypothetical protein KDE50_07290 [Caldilineaceae bacterium]|nr:hypothetical protein [Caldilineaceae bacterium]MCB0139695.1 hypothetical protein [Caldilineaceae bacterium]
MTQRKSSGSNAKNEGKSDQNNRKRPLRRRRRRRTDGEKNSQSANRTERSSRQSRGGGDKSSGDRRRRTSQARRRRRVRRSRNEPTAPSIMDDIEQEYTAPTSVFVYTHVVRPNSGGYEFRSESFPKSSRRIEDYQIDYSHIMGTILEVDPENLPKFEWYWGPDEEEPQEDSGEINNHENESPSAN